MVAVSIAWIPVITVMQGGQLYHYIQAIAAQLAPPVAAVYILAVLWPRCNEKVVILKVPSTKFAPIKIKSGKS